MIAIEDVIDRYRREFPRIEKAAKLTASHLRRRAARAHISCEITSRAKEISSFVTKIQHKQYDNPWLQVTDKAGVRIIVQHTGLLDQALDLVKSSLNLVGEPQDDRDAPGSEDRLQYPRLHVQTLAYGDETSEDGRPYECEIQIRTEATDLWARMSHKLMYKPSSTDVPSAVRRSLYRLIALVELYDLEVARGVDELAKHPSISRSNQLFADAEYIYRTFTDHHFRRDLSEDIFDVLIQTISDDFNYSERLTRFAEDRRSDLARAYADYGPLSDHFLKYGRYLLASQPESVVIFERLSNARMLLRGIWCEQLPESMLNDMAEVWGVSL